MAQISGTEILNDAKEWLVTPNAVRDILVYASNTDLTSSGIGTVDRTNILALVVKNNGAGTPGGAICINPGASSNIVKTVIPVTPSAGFATGSSELTSLKEQCSK